MNPCSDRFSCSSQFSNSDLPAFTHSTHCLLHFSPIHFADEESMSPEEEIKFIQGSKLFNSRTKTKTQVSYSHYAFLFYRGLSSSHSVFFKNNFVFLSIKYLLLKSREYNKVKKLQSLLPAQGQPLSTV